MVGFIVDSFVSGSVCYLVVLLFCFGVCGFRCCLFDVVGLFLLLNSVGI